ncbi:Protein EARLY FLOWERING 3 [Hirschfeldia incana]|nr:Protein EARLY FLOWERING 3 [Hirschfeldia incana]
MKRGKEDEEVKVVVEPMFPRLNVKDAAADKGGGPRAPPRNKMALYEHLSIPSSHRFTTDRVGSLPRHTNTFFPPPPTNQPCGVERNLTSQHHLDSSASGHATQMPFMGTLPHRRDQRKKTVRAEEDFAVPVYSNNSSTRLQCDRTTSEKRTALFRDQAKGSSKKHSLALGCERVSDSNASLRQVSRSSRLDQDGDGSNRVMETDDGVEESHGRSGRYVSVNEEACGDDDDLMVDSSSLSSVDVSPDDVVGVLGQKRFWRARKAIANQQRIFAVQLFELHRLIKVQRLIASSSDVLLDEISYIGKVAAKSFPLKKKLLPSEFIVKPPPLPIHRSSDSEKTDQHRVECSAENVVEKSSNQGQHQPSNYMPFASNPPPAVNGCYYPPPQPPPSGGNQQWLIPVMSPSEGLIYKPHPGSGGHTGPPVCGGYYGHFMPAPMLMGSFMGGGGPPPFHPGVGNGYFPPYGIMPTMMNPYGSGQQQQQQQQQPSEQMNQFVHPGNLQYASALNTQQHSSVNEEVSQQQPTKSHPRARKGRQRSTGSSSPSGTNSFRPLSVVDDNDEPDEQMMTTTTTTTRTTVTQTTRDGGGGVTRVIKVVPHNAKLASENAARIFRSIQEERKHYDSFSNHS